jgi:hypothetical protein
MSNTEHLDPSVSDFGISAGSPAARTEHHIPTTADPRTRLAAVVRRVIASTVAAQVDDDEISSAAEVIEQVATSLESHAFPGRRARPEPDPRGDPQDFFPTSPVIGLANPISPPVHITLTGGEVIGTAEFGYPYEGPPTCVHGGVLALVFDELLGAANIASGHAGMTGTLKIRYRRPTPLLTKLRLAARFVRKDGRKIHSWGGIYHGDVLTAEAEGVFIEVVPERFLAMTAEHASATSMADVAAEADRIGLTRSSGSSKASDESEPGESRPMS